MKIKMGKAFQLALAFVMLFACMFPCFGRAVAEEALTGKKIIDTYDGGSLKSTEPAYKTGNMYAFSTSDGWTDQVPCKAEPDWTGAKYVMVYVHNMAQADDYLGVMFNYNDQYHYTPKTGSKLYLDDMRQVIEVSAEDFGSYRFGVKIPAGFKGYLKCQLTDLSQYGKVWEQSNPDWTKLDSMLAVNYSAKNFTVAVDTLTISYDDDLLTPLTMESALFGRDPSLIVEREGKLLIDSYDDAAYYAKYFETKESTESDYPGIMYRPKLKDDGNVAQWWSDELPSADHKDWSGAEYFFMWVNNVSDSPAVFSVALHQKGNMMRVKAGVAVYFDDGASVKTLTTGSNFNTGFWTGVEIPAGAKGYLKIPFNAAFFQDRYSDTSGITLDCDAAVDKASYNADGELYVDALSLSFDDDIDVVFDGVYDNRRTLELGGTEQNEFRVIENFYEVNWKRDWFDSAPNGMAGGKGAVTYSEIADSMTVEWNAVGGTVCMWGHDQTLRGDAKDWSEAKYMVNEVKNNKDTKAKYKLLVSNGDTNVNVTPGAAYFLKDKSGKVTACVAKNSALVLPANFEGWVLVPAESFGANLDLKGVTRFSLEFDLSAAGSVTFRNMGYAVSDNLLFEEATVIDHSKYFILPEDIVLVPAPPRPSTEPATAIENNVKK